MSAAPRAHVVIAGGGVAAFEALIALRFLAGERVDITLLSPGDELVLRDTGVGAPFGAGGTRRLSLARVCADFGAHRVSDALVAVDAGAAVLDTAGGERVAYDSLVLATGMTGEAPFAGVTALGAPGWPDAVAGLVADIDAGAADRIACVVPGRVSWTLPLYELALLAGRRLAAAGREGHVELITPEAHPLALFGPRTGKAVRELLDDAGVRFAGSTCATVHGHEIEADGRSNRFDHVVAVALPRGGAPSGLPATSSGFLRVDAHGAVTGIAGVFAAGDVTAFPVKQAGLAVRQADAVAQAVAHRHGAAVSPEPFEPVLRGAVLTDGRPRFGRGVPGADDGALPLAPLWSTVAGRHLAPYLAGAEARTPLV